MLLHNEPAAKCSAMLVTPVAQILGTVASDAMECPGVPPPLQLCSDTSEVNGCNIPLVLSLQERNVLIVLTTQLRHMTRMLSVQVASLRIMLVTQLRHMTRMLSVQVARVLLVSIMQVSHKVATDGMHSLCASHGAPVLHGT